MSLAILIVSLSHLPVSEWMSVKRWHTTPFAKSVVKFYATSMVELVLLISTLYLLFPTQSRYIVSALPVDMQLETVVYFAGAGLEISIAVWVASMYPVYACYWCMAMFQQLLWLDSLLL